MESPRSQLRHSSRSPTTVNEARFALRYQTTGVAVMRNIVVPSPSCPLSFWPQH